MSVILDTRDLLAELGVRRIINAVGTYTTVGGSRMDPEVVDAWAQAASAAKPTGEAAPPAADDGRPHLKKPNP